MQKILAVVFLGFILQVNLTTQGCPDGTFTSAGGSDMANHGTCTSCFPICTTCTSQSVCTAYISRVKGVDSTPTKLCLSASVMGSSIGYNSNTDTCDPCMKGCALCGIDYNICYGCDAGWDFDQNGLQCVRATLGLAAVVLALSVLVLIVTIISCILACKLS
jgi:hypothetical protein